MLVFGGGVRERIRELTRNLTPFVFEGVGLL